MESKICKYCGLDKSIDNYNFRKDTGKYRNECKECQKQYSSSYYMKNKEIIITENNKRYELNKEHYNKHRRDEYKKNKNYVLKRNKN